MHPEKWRDFAPAAKIAAEKILERADAIRAAKGGCFPNGDALCGEGDNMPQLSERTPEDIGRELEEAKEAESKLAEEANRSAERMRAAATDGKLGLQEAAMAGKSPKEGSPLTKARRRAEELPALMWAASLQRLELLLEYQTHRAEVADRDKKEAYREIHELEQERTAQRALG
jgi:hypothetical protein